MRKIKFLIGLVLFCAMGYVGYIAHEKMNMSDAEKFMLANVEALTHDESTSKKYKCYSIFTGEGHSISCATCMETSGTPPWYHFGDYCTRP